MRRVIFLLALLATTTAPALGAQGIIRGVLFDSLRTEEPIPNAIITVDGRPERTRTDGRGRFRFTSLPVGVYTLRYQMPWLDSLALPPLTARAEVFSGAGGSEVELATPSLGTLQRAICGGWLASEAGILRGEIRGTDGAPLAGVFVGAVWAQASIARSGVTNELMGTVDTTDATGSFALCGVPTGTNFMLRAGDDTLGTGELVVDIGEYPVRHIELVAGPSSGTGRVNGRIVAGRAQILNNATVSIPGDSIRGARVDESGRFTIEGLPPRTTQLFVRAIGYMPRYVLVNGAAGTLELGDVDLASVAQELAERRVTAQATSLSELEFRQRESTGNGVFLDEAAVKKYPILSATALANESIEVRSSGGRYPRTVLRRGSETCLPRFFLDGVDWGIARDGVEEQMILQGAKRIEIYVAAFMPAQYNDFNGCGVVLVWTR